jgi:hypothetical protein
VLKLTEVLDFCFPEGIEHPKAAARLFLLCEVGPLRDGWLWGGAYNARRKLTEYEIETMVSRIEREDIVASVMPVELGRSSMLPPTPEQENEVLAGVPEAMKKPYMLRRPHIVAMLAPCSTEPWTDPVEPDPDARISVVEQYVLACAAAVLDGVHKPVDEEGADRRWPQAPVGEDEEPPPAVEPGLPIDEFVAALTAQLLPEGERPEGLDEVSEQPLQFVRPHTAAGCAGCAAGQ